MRKTQPEPVPDPASVPVGTELGEWRVVSWAGRGTYGTVYRVERRGRKQEGPYALKLAMHSRDERFERERELLSRVSHPNVPRLEGYGVWQHPLGAYPYLVMQWIAGEPLYEWATQRNPTSRQVLKLLAQVARALEATSEVDGLHRDVKGDNVMVRLSDEQAFLTDFGTGVYRGAATLTMQVLPPGTANYRSPEAWEYQRVFARHPNAHYRASVCDDLFALGVTAYRLVTDEYPPPTDPREEGAEVWARGGPGPRPPRELNAHVCEELNELILRLLGQAERRFKGQARLAAEALEHAANTSGPGADARLFEWETVERSNWSREEQSLAGLRGHRQLRRDRDAVQRRERQDAEAKAQAARVKEQARTADVAKKPQPQPEPSDGPWIRRLLWLLPGAGLLALMLGPERKYEPEPPLEKPEEPRAEKPDAGTADGGTADLGTEALASVSVEQRAPLSWAGVTERMPTDPLPGQRKPPCNLDGALVIRGGCWLKSSNENPPCENGFYEWNERCYWPILSQARVPTSEPR